MSDCTAIAIVHHSGPGNDVALPGKPFRRAALAYGITKVMSEVIIRSGLRTAAGLDADAASRGASQAGSAAIGGSITQASCAVHSWDCAQAGQGWSTAAKATLWRSTRCGMIQPVSTTRAV